MKRRCLVCTFLALAALAVVVQPVSAQVVGNPGDPVFVVYPTGTHPADVDNVQFALDNVASPGTVVMKATDMSGGPLAFNFGGTALGNGGVVAVLRPDITLTGDGWDDVLDEPKTKVVNGGGPFRFSPSVAGNAMVFAVRAHGVKIRILSVSTTFAYTGVYIASFDQVASHHPVVIERNHISALNYAVIAAYTAAFPVRIDGNVFKAKTLVDGRWIGFTLRTITTPFTYDEPVVPEDASANPVRYPFEVTNNRLIKTPGATGETLIVWGWSNYYNGLAGADLNDAELGCRRGRPNSSVPFLYQCVPGDNGPVLISGNSISMEAVEGSFLSAITVAWGDAGLNHAVVAGNTVSGSCYAGVRSYPYGHDRIIVDNEFSGVQASHPILLHGGNTVVADNVFGPLLTRDMPLGLPQPAMFIASSHYYPGLSPVPRPAENNVIMNNDYRLTGATTGAILLASRAELLYPTGVGSEVKNNVIFETGRFPPGTGGPSNHVIELNTLINPATGLPYVHDNRIVGLSADGLGDPGIGWAVRRVNEIRKMLKERRP